MSYKIANIPITIACTCTVPFLFYESLNKPNAMHMSLMVSISGIRGIVGDSLTPEIVVKYSAAFAEYSNRGAIVVGRDGRVTGKNIESIVVATLLHMGCHVIDLGICPTPTVGLAIERFHAAGGISITASHNPMIWNGLKFMGSTGMCGIASPREPHGNMTW